MCMSESDLLKKCGAQLSTMLSTVPSCIRTNLEQEDVSQNTYRTKHHTKVMAYCFVEVIIQLKRVKIFKLPIHF